MYQYINTGGWQVTPVPLLWGVVDLMRACALRWAWFPPLPLLIKTNEKTHKHNQAKYLQNRGFA